jgi:4-hydroxy-tetrahydrodipicolinate synthase
MTRFAEGVWPVMLTPYTEDLQVDAEGLGALTSWYIDKGSAGLFALCQSSEIFLLSLAERLEVLRLVQVAAAGRVPVIASGHVSYAVSEQVDELQAVAELGPDALVLISNRLAGPDATDAQVVRALEGLIDKLPAYMPLGVYECPYPFKRLLSVPVLELMRDSGRFAFVKDTCCDLATLRMRLELLAGSRVQLYNANASTLLESLRAGASGYSGVMANVHPEPYVWLCAHADERTELVEDVQALLTVGSFAELKEYPSNAKLALGLKGVPIQPYGRAYRHVDLTATSRLEAEQLNRFGDLVNQLIASA